MNAYSKLIALLAAVSVTASATTSRPGPDIGTKDRPESTATYSFHVELGDLLTSMQRFGAARQAYAEAVRSDRAMGWLPVEGLRRIANAYYFEGDYQSAATTLAELAEEAGSLKNTEAQVWALADAAWLANLAGDESELVSYRRELDRLCLSDNSLSALHQAVNNSLMADFSVFAPHLPSW
jgi:hypothetical protein